MRLFTWAAGYLTPAHCCELLFIRYHSLMATQHPSGDLCLGALLPQTLIPDAGKNRGWSRESEQGGDTDVHTEDF